jgi:hypothetical protein
MQLVQVVQSKERKATSFGLLGTRLHHLHHPDAIGALV